MRPLLDDKPVPPDLDLGRVRERLGRAEHGDLQNDLGQVLQRQRREPRVACRGVAGASGHHLDQGSVIVDRPETAAEPVVVSDGDESAGPSGQPANRRRRRNRMPLESGGNRLTREVQQRLSFVRVQHGF